MPEQDLPPPYIHAKAKAQSAAASPQAAIKIPTKSLWNARAAFRNFSLSKFPDTSAATNNFVAKGQEVSTVQRRNQINHLKSLDASGRSLRIALSDGDLKQYLPSFDGKAVVLAELMDLIQRKMLGTEFYASGDPTLVRLSVQSRVANIIQTIKSGSDGST